MIKLEIRIWEHGPAGLKVKAFGSGEAKSEGEQLYLEIIQGALDTAVKVATKKYAELGLAAVPAVASADGSQPGTVLEIPFPAMQPPAAPKFSDFARMLLEELAVLQVTEGQTASQAAVMIARKHVDDFAAKFLAWAQHQQRQGAGQGPN